MLLFSKSKILTRFGLKYVIDTLPVENCYVCLEMVLDTLLMFTGGSLLIITDFLKLL